MWQLPSTVARSMRLEAVRATLLNSPWLTTAVTTGLIASVVMTGTPLGRTLLRNTLGLMPAEVRNLPGIQAVTGPIPPNYVSSVFDIAAPLSVAVTPDARFLYVAEGKDERLVRRIDLLTGERVELAPPETTPGLRKPVSVAVGEAGLVYVADLIRGVVDMYAPDGSWLGSLATPGPQQFWQPLAVDTDRDGYVYVTNSVTGGPAFARYASDGALVDVETALVVEGVPLSFASGIATAAGGRLLISDSNNSRLVVLSADGTAEGGQAAAYGNQPGDSKLSLPRGVSMDTAGRVLVADANDHSIALWDLRADPPEYIYRFGSAGYGDGEMNFPNDVTVDARGTIYIADRDNDRVQIWR